MASEKPRKVQKSNQLNQANFSDFSLSCYRVLLNLISKMQRHDVNGDNIPLTNVSRYCSLSVAEYAKEFDIEPANAYAILKEATDKLMKTSFSIQKEHGILKINVCSQAYYRKEQGRIDIEFTPNIMPHLADLTSNFTMYNLNAVAGFASIYTTRFYELVMQFKTTGILEISVKNLRFHLGCADKFKQYYDFKLKTFGHAINEINQQWTLNIELIKEIKTGRTVTDLVFTFKPTFIRKAYDPVRQKMRTELTTPRRKPKQDDNNTPPPVHPDQQELPNINDEKPKTIVQKVAKKMVRSKYAEKNFAPSVKKFEEDVIENGITKENLKTYGKERTEEIKQSAQEVKAIITALMKKGLTAAEAKIKAIELDLI